MKKKFLSVVALGLAFGFAFSAGCSKDPADPVKPFDPADPTTAKTEDDIYTAVKYGVDEFGKYAGAITIVSEYTEAYSETQGTESASDESTGKTTVAWDPATKDMYMIMERTSTEKEGTETVVSKSTTISKLFKVDEQFYAYGKQTQKEGDAEEQSMEMRYKVTEAYVDQTIARMKETYANVEDVYSYLPDASYDFTTIKNAYNTVFSAQLETQKAKDANAKATATVTATNTDGTLEAKIAMNTETTDEIEDGITGLMKNDTEFKVIAKDGKLSEYSMNGVASASATVEGVACTMSESEAGLAKFTYSFDKTAFDAIDAGDMSTATDMPNSGGGNYVEGKFSVVVGDWTWEVNVGNSAEYPAQDAFNNYVGSYFNYSSSYTVAWYTDSACTTAVDWTDKKVDYLKDKTFYGKMTIEEGKAVVLKEITWADKRSDAYKIVFGESEGYNYISSVQGFTVDTDVANNKYEFEDRAGFSDSLVIYVDGVAQAETATDFTYEAGKMYIVNYCTEYNDTHKKFNIFKMN